MEQLSFFKSSCVTPCNFLTSYHSWRLSPPPKKLHLQLGDMNHDCLSVRNFNFQGYYLTVKFFQHHKELNFISLLLHLWQRSEVSAAFNSSAYRVIKWYTRSALRYKSLSVPQCMPKEIGKWSKHKSYILLTTLNRKAMKRIWSMIAILLK